MTTFDLKYPFPKPNILWGDYNIPTWTRKQNGWFDIFLIVIASAIVFADQNVITRVELKIKEVIKLAKEGKITSDEACDKIQLKIIFSDEEIENIKINYEKYGEKINFGFANQKPLSN